MEKKKRGREKGIKKPEGSGKKATGRVRNKTFSIRVTMEEKIKISEILSKLKFSQTDSLLMILEYWDCKQKNKTP